MTGARGLAVLLEFLQREACICRSYSWTGQVKSAAISTES